MPIELEIAPDKTLKITFGALVGIITFVFFLAGWLISIDIRAQTTNERVDQNSIVFQDKYEKVGDAVISIDKRLSRIEVLLENQKRGN